MKFIHYATSLLLPLFIFGKTTIIINQFPANTPSNDRLFLAGNTNGWNPADESYGFTKNDSTYSLELGTVSGSLQFRVTRGSWLSVETNSLGQDIKNRSITISDGDTVYLNILTWKDLKAVQNGKNNTAKANVFVIDPAMDMPQLNRTRRIWVYLPTHYFSHLDERYPVLYMHDGQNLFDASTSFVGEWGIDESMNTMINGGAKGAIVVGIDNGGSFRINELTPYKNATYGGGEGGKYMDFIVNTLMPYINTNFRTLTDRNSTGIMGSSLGGLISCYGALKYQNVFGKIGIFSPAFWINNEIFSFIDSTGYQAPMKVYFMSGTNESQTMVPKMKQVHDLMVTQGFDSTQMKVVVKSDGQHSEWFWKREFPAAYQFLFDDFTTGITEKSILIAEIKPIPANDQLTVSFQGFNKEIEIYITDMLGKVVLQQLVVSGKNLNISHLKSGVYLLNFTSNTPTRPIKFIKE